MTAWDVHNTLLNLYLTESESGAMARVFLFLELQGTRQMGGGVRRPKLLRAQPGLSQASLIVS